MYLTFEDCVALCDLNEPEVLVISEHEHIPPLAAVELGDYLIRTPQGEERVKAIIRDHIAAAAAAGDHSRALALKHVLRDYILRHPRCESRQRCVLCPQERREIA